MLFYLAYLQAIPTDVYEAAAIDGAGAWRTFWKVTFPLLKPGHFFVSTLLVIGGLKMFDQAYIASGGPAGRTTRRSFRCCTCTASRSTTSASGSQPRSASR